MKTRYNYIYNYADYFLIRFRDEAGNYVQKTFGYGTKNKKQVLEKAKAWRDGNIPDSRKIGKRLLQNKPQKNKQNKLPAGISQSFRYKNTRKKKYKYSILSISAGKDENGKAILRRISIKDFPNKFSAIEEARRIRAKLLTEYNKNELKDKKNK